MKLSILLISYNMRREVPKTLQSLARAYQLGAGKLDYEVLVIDNGSSEKLDVDVVQAMGPQFKYHYLQDAPASPAYAFNYAASHSSGDILCLMIDGARMLTPGVFTMALAAFRAFDNPLVMTRCFHLGPASQNDSILQGYSKAREDELLNKINWPEDGYRLFEIGTPMQGDFPKITWFNKMLESNCLFLKRSVFEAIGGANERFDIPGGGMMNMDLYHEAVSLPDTQPVLLIGEGSFHQLHGGTTTNVSREEQAAKLKVYEEQYQKIRGKAFTVSEKNPFFLGHLPTQHSKIHQRN